MWGTSNRKSRTQKKKRPEKQVKVETQFASICQCSAEVAQTVCKKFKWDLQQAMEHYYGNRHKYPASVVKKEASKVQLKALDDLFNKYVDDEKDTTGSDFQTLHEDIGIDFEAKGPFMLAFKFNCQTYGQMTREEFKKGFTKWESYKLPDMKIKASSMVKNFNSNDFSNMYTWTFNYMKDNDQKKTIPKEYAHAIWSVLLKDHKPALPCLAKFLEFVEESLEDDEVKAITSDTWKQTREFLTKCKDQKTFENDGAWPTLIDKFLDKHQS